MKNIIVYDLEIIKAITSDNISKIDGIEYCNGWNDHNNMGVSVIGAYDLAEDRYRIFTKDNWYEFVKLAQNKKNIMVGFNSIPFDNKVLKASNIIDIPDNKSYDILREIWLSSGLSEVFQYPSHAGYGLNAVASINGISGKTGNGAKAPIDWQKGNIGAVIDYCIQDVNITTKLIKKIITKGGLYSPKNNQWLDIKSPYSISL